MKQLMRGILTISLIATMGMNVYANETQTQQEGIEVKVNPYQEIFDNMTEEEELLLAKIIYLESRGESFEGQCGVLEVILNRVNNGFDGYYTITEIIYDRKYAVQFITIFSLPDLANKPKEFFSVQYDVIDEVRNNGNVALDTTYEYFATSKTNGTNFYKLGNHYFSK